MGLYHDDHGEACFLEGEEITRRLEADDEYQRILDILRRLAPRHHLTDLYDNMKERQWAIEESTTDDVEQGVEA